MTWRTGQWDFSLDNCLCVMLWLIAANIDELSVLIGQSWWWAYYMPATFIQHPTLDSVMGHMRLSQQYYQYPHCPNQIVICYEMYDPHKIHVNVTKNSKTVILYINRDNFLVTSLTYALAYRMYRTEADISIRKHHFVIALQNKYVSIMTMNNRQHKNSE